MILKRNLICCVLLLFATNFYSQVGIGTTNPSTASMLEVSSTSDGGITYGGLMPPRVPNVSARNAINPSVGDMGLLIFVNSTQCLQIWSGTQWLDVKCMDGDVIIDPPGPVLLGKQDFEASPSSPLLPLYSATGGSYTTGNGIKPTTPLYVSPNQGYGINFNTGLLTFGPINASAHGSATFKLRLGGFAKSTGNGLDNNDSVIIYISISGVGGPYTSQIRIYGGPNVGTNSNNTWGFDATRTVSVTYDSNGVIRDFTSGTGNVDGISYIEVTGIPNSSNIAVKVELRNNQINELWVIDDAEVYGN